MGAVSTEVVRTGAMALTTSQTRWCEPDFGKKLRADLRDAERGGPDNLLPVVDPDTANEARAAIPHFEAGLAGCDPDEIDRMVTKLAAAYPAQKISEDEAIARRRLYADLLGDIPFDILAIAFRRAGQTCTFFPSVAEIRKAAAPELAQRRWRLVTLRRIVDKHEREYVPPIPPENLCKPEEAQAIIAEVFGRMKVPAKPDPDKEERRARTKRRAGAKG